MFIATQHPVMLREMRVKDPELRRIAIKARPSIVDTWWSTEEEKLLAVSLDGKAIHLCLQPSVQLQIAAVNQDPDAVFMTSGRICDEVKELVRQYGSDEAQKYIEEEDQYFKDVNADPVFHLQDSRGWAILYIENPTPEQQEMAGHLGNIPVY